MDTRVDCPQWYNVSDIVQSARVDDPVLNQYMKDELNKKKRDSESTCDGNAGTILEKGGWCLTNRRAGAQVVFNENTKIHIPKEHVAASKGVVDVLADMINKGEIKSLNDFGAGVGQYKAPILQSFPKFEYHAFDGAGNVESYTKGQVEYFDLTLPLALNKMDWVMSLEVGEHIPSKYEGMVIRNLHRHNCKGIILSWAILGQNGYHHVNNHSNDYIIKVFDKLGYDFDSNRTAAFRQAKGIYFYFKDSIMVFRRKEDAC